MALNSRSAGHSMIQLAATNVGELITCILLTAPEKGGMGALVTLVVGSSGVHEMPATVCWPSLLEQGTRTNAGYRPVCAPVFQYN